MRYPCLHIKNSMMLSAQAWARASICAVLRGGDVEPRYYEVTACNIKAERGFTWLYGWSGVYSDVWVLGVSMRVSVAIYKLVLVLLTSILYGFFSSTSPDAYRWPELAIGALLSAIVGWGVLVAFHPRTRIPLVVKVAVMYLIVAPTITGVMLDTNSLFDYIRDIVPLMFMFLPVFLYKDIEKRPILWAKVLIIWMFVVGFGFAIRYYFDPSVDISLIFRAVMFGANRDNPWQYPASIFSMAFSLSLTIYYFIIGRIPRAFFALFAYILFLGVYVSTASRAPLVLALLAAAPSLLVAYKQTRRKLGRFIGLLFLMVILTAFAAYSNYESIAKSIQLLAAKTQNVGILNGRDDEIAAVLQNTRTPLDLLFGVGWGGFLENPVVSNQAVRFVHNSLAFFYFKSGLLGLAAYLTYLVWILFPVYINLIRMRGKPLNLLISISSIAPLTVAILLEASFKSLSFGFLMSALLAVSLSDHLIALRAKPRYLQEAGPNSSLGV